MPDSISAETFCMGCFTQHEKPVSPCPVCGCAETAQTLSPHQLRPRTILNGKYLLGMILGEGGFGITYIGWDLNLHLKVAIKEYYPTGFVTRETTSTTTVQPFAGSQSEYFLKGRERFVEEARSLAKFRSLSGIVAVNDFFQENGTAYIVMEYIDGQTMKSYLAKMGGSLPSAQVFDMMKPVLASLAEIHKTGLIHRDISPDNIMIGKDGCMKLLDFGAAREFADSGNKSISIMLKPGFAPEEQYRSRGVQGPWTDIYALCATMYRCITGVTPDESSERMRSDIVKPPSVLGAAVSPIQEAALMKGMAVLQENRWQSVEQLARELYVTPPAAVAPPVAPPAVPPQPAPAMYTPEPEPPQPEARKERPGAPDLPPSGGSEIKSRAPLITVFVFAALTAFPAMGAVILALTEEAPGLIALFGLLGMAASIAIAVVMKRIYAKKDDWTYTNRQIGITASVTVPLAAIISLVSGAHWEEALIGFAVLWIILSVPLIAVFLRVLVKHGAKTGAKPGADNPRYRVVQTVCGILSAMAVFVMELFVNSAMMDNGYRVYSFLKYGRYMEWEDFLYLSIPIAIFGLAYFFLCFRQYRKSAAKPRSKKTTFLRVLPMILYSIGLITLFANIADGYGPRQLKFPILLLSLPFALHAWTFVGEDKKTKYLKYAVIAAYGVLPFVKWVMGV